MPETAYVALGSNLGDRKSTIEQAVALIGQLPGTRVTRRSALIETEPVGGPGGQPGYLNGALELRTELGPHRLLDKLHRIEAELGRVRTVRFGARTIDLDLLLYGQRVAGPRVAGPETQPPGLILPHPRLHERAFVLEPLAEIAPGAIVPARRGSSPNTVSALLAAQLDALRHQATMSA
ncbi:MAG: 2-amino-4-hydroxy-6-hydroxymethyldihydropteridine diphosphokinase [Planctomycetota bacterium]